MNTTSVFTCPVHRLLDRSAIAASRRACASTRSLRMQQRPGSPTARRARNHDHSPLRIDAAHRHTCTSRALDFFFNVGDAGKDPLKVPPRLEVEARPWSPNSDVGLAP